MSPLPLVSVLIPLYNKAEWIESTISSVLAQTYSNIEIIVIDDGSTDDSGDLVAAMSDPRISLQSRENQGANATRNELLERANGEFVQFLDADDLLLPKKLEIQVSGLQAGADVSLCPVWLDQVDGDRRPDEPVLNSARTVIGQGVPTLAPLHRKSTLLRIGGWSDGLAASQEFDLHLRLVMGGHWAASHETKEPLALARSVPNSTSSDEPTVYRSKLDSLRSVSAHANLSHRRFLALAIANAARHLARFGAFDEARDALDLAMSLDDASISEFPRRLRWLGANKAIVRAEWADSRAKSLLGKNSNMGRPLAGASRRADG